MKNNMKQRIEHDLLGDVHVSADALYGAQTQRAVKNFPVGNQRTIGQFPSLIRGLIHVKKAAAVANLKIGLLEKSVACAIMNACDKVLKEGMYDQFSIHHLHGGGGTSANMNTNEVLANIGEESLGGQLGKYQLVHPNDHVNLNQSTNDVYPTACHIAVILEWPVLKQALHDLANQIDAKAGEFSEHRRIARTCLQDAVAISFADLLGGYSAFLRRNIFCIERTVKELYAVSIGGTIVGRAEDVPSAYMEAVIPALCKITGDSAYRHSENLFDAAQNPDDLVRVSSEMDIMARGLVKICQDLRLMNSGPETGFNEVILPPVQPGSSIMPGKINPVIPEFAMQLCFKVMGNHAACSASLDHGELDLNVWESTAIFSILESMELLENAARTLGEKCISDLTVNTERNTANVQTIIPLLTDLMKRHGYSKVSKICKQAKGDIHLLRKLLNDVFPGEK
ncbi:MAG: hypothetical protein KAS17_02630 [Victivallaceae bacterium]|nr:hypothetical protein [Victivallaceae bacterium]